QDAIQACEQVPAADGADAGLKEKTDRALASLREKLAAQQSQGGGTSDGGSTPVNNGGGGTATQPPAGGAPAAATGADPFVAAEAPPPADSYQWSLGGELGVLGNLGAAKDEFGNDLYGPSGFN